MNSKMDTFGLVSKILEAEEKTKATKVIIDLEPSGHYWSP